MVTVALVGCAHIHTPGFINKVKQRPDIRVKWVWDHNATRGQRRAAELGGEYVADVQRVWEDGDVAAVIICSETDRHQELVSAAARAGKDIFAEKPLGLRAADSYAMADAIDAGIRLTPPYGKSPHSGQMQHAHAAMQALSWLP